MNIDTLSLLVTVPTNITLKDLRKKLLARGYEFGFFAGKEAEDCTLKNILESKIPNQWHLRYGEIEDICLALVARTPFGDVRTKKVPRAATGPDLKKIFIGSESSYGDIQEVTLQIIPKSEIRKSIKVKAHKDFLRDFWASGIRPLTIERQKNDFLIELEGFRDIVKAEEKVIHSLSPSTRRKET